MGALKFGVRACANLASLTPVRECWKGTCDRTALYTAGSAIALTRAVHMLVLPHAVTAGASLYIEEEYLIVGKPEGARSN